MDVPYASPPRGLLLALAALFTFGLGQATPSAGSLDPLQEVSDTPTPQVSERILPLPETFLSYDLTLTLDPQSRLLLGEEHITWTNPGREAVTSIPLHLYLNAFAHNGSTWMSSASWRQAIMEENVEDYEDPWGYVRIQSLTLVGSDGGGEGGSGGAAQLPFKSIQPDDENPLDETLVEVELPEPVAPGETLRLALKFESQLPIPVARTGGYEDFFLIAQFFPKVSVREVKDETERWVLHQFHGFTEFFADFADFKVTLTLPEGWIAEGTGRQVEAPDTSTPGSITYSFEQRGVHDVALVAGSALIQREREVQPKGQDNPVLLRVLVPEGTEILAEEGLDQLESGLDTLSQRVGPYPYDTLTMVMPPARARPTAGMEYPTFITGTIGDPVFLGTIGQNLDFALGTAAHELAHQYFYGVVASNEFEEAYLDEGFTEYWGNQAALGVTGPISEAFGRSRSEDINNRGGVLRGRGSKVRAVGQRPSWMAEGSTGTLFYRRPEAILRTVAGRFGQDKLDEIFQVYYRRYAFKHPRLEDFLAVCEEVGGADVRALVQEGFARGDLPDYRVTEVSASLIEAPDGLLFDAGGAALAPLERWEGAGEGPARPWRLEPGWRDDAGGGEDGAVTRPYLEVRRGEPQAEHDDDDDDDEEDDDGDGDVEEGAGTPGITLYRSYAEVKGGGWANLPVTLRFTFEDGSISEDTWAGRSPYIQYTFVGESPLTRVEVDPDGEIFLDADPRNNSLAAKGEDDWGEDLGGLFGTAIVWLMMGVVSWL